MSGTSVTVVGNVASDPAMRRVGAQDTVVVRFRVIANERKWDKVSGTWADGERFSARVSCWRGLGEHVHASLVMGDPVVVCGKLSVREYEVDGQRRYSTEIDATAVGPDLTRSTAVVTRRTRGGEEQAAGEVVTSPGPVMSGFVSHPAEVGGALDDEDVEGGAGPDPDQMPVVA